MLFLERRGILKEDFPYWVSVSVKTTVDISGEQDRFNKKDDLICLHQVNLTSIVQPGVYGGCRCVSPAESASFRFDCFLGSVALNSLLLLFSSKFIPLWTPAAKK